MSSNVALNVKLHSPDDWDHWENELLNQARAKDVIRILQGTQEPLKKPTNLPNDDFLTALVAPTNPTGVNRISAAASAGRRHRNNTAIQGEDTQPTPTPDSQETVQAETMDRSTHADGELDRAIKMFNVRLNLYKQRYFEWSEQKKAIEQIFIWMKQTVSPSYHKTYIAVTANWKEAYINLKEQVNQGRFISQRRIKDEYDQHLRSLKPSTRDLEAWITKWEELLLEAERKSMVIADDVLDWSTRFLDAIRPLDDAWTTAYEITIEEKIEDGTLTRRELANAFRRNLRKIRNRRPSRIYRGSFAVQEERMDDNSDEESYHYGRQPSRSLERKRGRTRSRSRSIGPPRKKKNQGPEQYQTTRPVCEACEGWHLLQFCYYLFKNLAPEEFIPRWGPRMRAKKFAEDHPDLVKKIKKMHLEEGASNAQVRSRSRSKSRERQESASQKTQDDKTIEGSRE
ncbi:hypothetical protein TMatcc_006719 [Talaromyces marneffei ATCC 18224]